MPKRPPRPASRATARAPRPGRPTARNPPKTDFLKLEITVRGTYYPPGKTVPSEDRKLFLAIESTNELSVQKAKVEITRLLKEELLKMQTSGIHHINKGRYKVL